MQFFLDTAEINEIKSVASLGVVDGVTTNPSLIAKSGRDQADVIREIVEIIDGPISAEVLSIDAKGMIEEGKVLSKIHKNVTIKIPMTVEGIKALKYFSDNEIKTNVTLVFSPNQALLAAKNGATFVSPFIGRLDDVGFNGSELISDIKTIYDNYGFTTQILAASIRGPLHIREVALMGCDVATMPYKVLLELFKHPLTDIGLEKFLSDHKNSMKK